MIKTIKKAFLIIIVILCVIIALACFARFVLGLGSWHGNSFEAYRTRAYTGGSYSLTELPPGSQDFKFQCYRYGLAAYSYAAFTLTGDDYTSFINSISATKASDLDSLGFTGKKVYEAMDAYDNYGAYIGFPKSKCDYVIDDNIEYYTIIYYDSYHGSGSHINAVVTNPDTGRIVIVNGGSN